MAHLTFILDGDGDPRSFVSRELAASLDVWLSLSRFERVQTAKEVHYKFGDDASLRVVRGDRKITLQVHTKTVIFKSKDLLPAAVDELSKALEKVLANTPRPSASEEDPQGGRRRRKTLKHKKRRISK